MNTCCSLLRTLRCRVFARAARRRNAKAIANSLPPELLARIFKLVQGECSCPLVVPGIFCECGRYGCDWSQWIHVTAVCQRWREVALDDPLLWNTILIERNSTERVLRCLRRSKSAPLDVVISDYDQVPNIIKTKLETCCTQLRQLHIEDVSNSAAELVSLITAAPLLQNLKLVSRHGSTSLPPMFADSTPRLQSLFVSGLQYRPQATSSNVSHVHLCNQDDWTSDDLQDFLQANTAMQSLVLSGCSMIDTVSPARP